MRLALGRLATGTSANGLAAMTTTMRKHERPLTCGEESEPERGDEPGPAGGHVERPEGQPREPLQVCPYCRKERSQWHFEGPGDAGKCRVCMADALAHYRDSRGDDDPTVR